MTKIAGGGHLHLELKSSFINAERTRHRVEEASIVIATAALALSLAACGGSDKNKSVEDTKPVQPTESQSVEVAPTEETEPTPEANSSEVREFLESYEGFVDEYVAFSEKYKSSDDLISMAQELTQVQAKAAELAREAEQWENEQLAADELALYTEVMARCNEKLATAIQNISEAA
ncbi:DUF6591 domain-containing protein [Schaalia vaccimaxillae]|uniref:DUF6591 domain-containing protein n=1 Tax=Schaalia vaccimaxillae TaxID=183916 RepID=UPI0003B71981|nr:DUF6591 domain-containing protein [Schaalia vaccimaxillae]